MSDETDFYQEYEKRTYDADNVIATDIKINPDFYIHKAIIKAQDCLTKENMKDGFMQYIIVMDHVEMLCRSAKIIVTEEYNTEIDSFKNTKEYKEESDRIQQLVKLANKKMQLMTTALFEKRTVWTPGRI